MSKKAVVKDVNKLSKGDKLIAIPGHSLPPGKVNPFARKVDKKGKLVDNYYIFNGIVNGAVVLRNVAGRLFSYKPSVVEGGYLEKWYEWTPWRSVPNDCNALYKTNRRRIWYKKAGFKVKADCNLDYDKFDLAKGLFICQERWKDKVLNVTKELNDKEAEEMEEVKEDEPLTIKVVEVQDDLFNAPFYNYVVHCINTDCKARGYIGKRINELYSIEEIYCDEIARYMATYKGANTDDFVLMANENVISLLTSPPHQKATYERLEQCLHELAWYCFDKGVTHLAMPKICCGANGLEWNKVKDLIVKMFNEVAVEYLEYTGFNESFSIIITVYYTEG